MEVINWNKNKEVGTICFEVRISMKKLKIFMKFFYLSFWKFVFIFGFNHFILEGNKNELGWFKGLILCTVTFFWVGTENNYKSHHPFIWWNLTNICRGWYSGSPTYAKFTNMVPTYAIFSLCIRKWEIFALAQSLEQSH